MDNKYDDIINLSRPVSNYKSMGLYARSAQFAPFSALTGFEEEIKEKNKVTQKKIILSEDLKDELNKKLVDLRKKIKERPLITLSYFDINKKNYLTIKDNILKIDETYKKIYLSTVIINIEDIIRIE